MNLLLVGWKVGQLSLSHVANAEGFGGVSGNVGAPAWIGFSILPVEGVGCAVLLLFVSKVVILVLNKILPATCMNILPEQQQLPKQKVQVSF